MLVSLPDVQRATGTCCYERTSVSEFKDAQL